MKERSMYTAMIGLIWAIGTILGPVIGGAFASSSASWRWAFYINLCLFAIVGPICLFVMPSYIPEPDIPLGTKLRHIDWVGSVLIAATFATFIVAFSFGGTLWAWSSGSFIAVIVVFAVCLIAFCIQQALALFTTKQRQIFPIEFLKRPHMIYFYIGMAATSSAFFFAIYYIPLYFSFVHDDSAIQAAIRLVCVSILPDRMLLTRLISFPSSALLFSS